MVSMSLCSLRGAALRRMLRANALAAPTVQYQGVFACAAAKAASPLAWNSRYTCANGASFSTTSRRQEHEKALGRSLRSDIQALQHLHALLSAPDSSLGHHFDAVLERLEQCHVEKRCIFVTGIGKSGIVARRLAATLASISIRSQWIHGSEWTHGDLGNLQRGDVVILISHSGDTAELQSLPALVATREAETVAIVGQATSAVAEACSLTLVVPATDSPSCPVPSRSIIVQEAICNAIVEHFLDSLASRSDAFRDNHPGGAIGNGFPRS